MEGMLENIAWEGSTPQDGGGKSKASKAEGFIGKGVGLEVMKGGMGSYEAGPKDGEGLLEPDCGGVYPY
jgi:hypothetical protein